MSDSSEQSAAASIQLSEAAADRVREFLDRDGGVGLRLGVRRTGCSGWAYEVDLAREIGADDHVFSERGITVVVDSASMPLVSGTAVDFVDEGLHRTFKFTNPNVTDECGCGESFAAEPAAS